MRVVGAFIFLVLLSALVISQPRPAAPTIIDVSWPNCGLDSFPRTDGAIIGVTGGLNFHPNTCLARETAISGNLSAYVNTGYAGRDKALSYANFPKHCPDQDERCLAYNYGYNAGLYDANYALRSGLITATWWLDVEFGNSWSDDAMVNRAELQGTLDALKPYAAPGRLGFYSYPFQWDIITAKWRNGYPAWVATGSKHKKTAEDYCRRPSFTGGPIRFSQYTSGYDYNLPCQ